MATSASTATFLADQMSDAGTIRLTKMFGEYGVYCDEKVVAFVCDDQLFVKPTEEGRTFIGEPEMAPAYPGSKDYFRIDEGCWEDRVWMAQLIRTTADALPLPKKKRQGT